MATTTASFSGSQLHNRLGSTVKDVRPTNEKIPLVSHTITDEDIGNTEGEVVQPIPLKKVVKLLIDPHSEHLLERHLHALRKVVKHYRHGFILKDLVDVFKILDVCADRVETEAAYVDVMVDLLRLCSVPFLKQRTSDEITYELIAIRSVSQLGYLMRVPNSVVRRELCENLVRLYTDPPTAAPIQRHQPSTLTFNQRIVEKSDISETLIKSIDMVHEDMDIRLLVLDVLQKLSKNSERTCNQMLAANAANKICSSMMDVDNSGQLLFRSVDILWNFMENGDQTVLAEQLSDSLCISQIQDAFTHQLTQGYSHYDRQLRNDLLVLACLTARCSSHSEAGGANKAPFLETGFIHKIVLFSTFQEVKSHNVLVKHLKLLQNSEDFELKKLLVTLLVILSADTAVIPVYSEGHVMLALLSYIKLNDETSGASDWSPAQYEELQLQALAALSTLGPLMLEDFMTCQGSTRLLMMLEWCITPDDFVGAGNSFHGDGGRGTKRAQMRHCLRLLRAMVSTGAEALLQDLCDQGAINQVTGLLNKFLTEWADRDDAVGVEMQADLLFILSNVCETDMHRKELFGTTGVDVVISYLRMDVGLLSMGQGHTQLLLAAVDCVWCAVVGCYVTEDYFLEKEGVFLLLDLLHGCPRSMHNLLLGCLLDLMENTKCVAHVTTWRGPGDITAPHVLCDLWRREEADLGVQREADGCIADPAHPLAGSGQAGEGVTSLPAAQPSRAIVEVYENLRAKVYSIFCKLGFVDLPGIDTNDHVTLTIIEHYLDIKIGEVWLEIIDELKDEAVRPVTPDQEALEAIHRTVGDRSEYVKQIQRQLLDTQITQDVLDEQQYYAQIRDNFRQREKAMQDFNDFVARTSNFDLLKVAKQRQEKSIDASRVQNNYRNSDTFHSIDLPNLNTTTFSSRQVKVESPPYKKLEKHDPIPESAERSDSVSTDL